MRTLNNFKKQAKKHQVILMGLTGARNGYPEPDYGWYAEGFDTYQQAEEFAKKYGHEVCVVTYKDGQNYATYDGEAFSPFTIDENWYGDNFYFVKERPANYWEITFCETEREFNKYFYAKGRSEKQKEEGDKYKIIFDELKDLKDDEMAIIDVTNLAVYDIIKKEDMSFRDDTYNKTIGVAFFIDESLKSLSKYGGE